MGKKVCNTTSIHYAVFFIKHYIYERNNSLFFISENTKNEYNAFKKFLSVHLHTLHYNLKTFEGNNVRPMAFLKHLKAIIQQMVFDTFES